MGRYSQAWLSLGCERAALAGGSAALRPRLCCAGCGGLRETKEQCGRAGTAKHGCPLRRCEAPAAWDGGVGDNFVADFDGRADDADGGADVAWQFDDGELEGKFVLERFAGGVQSSHGVDGGGHRE